MNLASFLLCLVFAAIGYVLYPMLLPKLVESKIVAESSLSDEYKKEQAEKNKPKADDAKSTDITKVETDPKPEVKVEPKPIPVPVQPAPVTPTPDPAPVAEVKLSDADFITALQSSVKAGDVNEFKFEQVIDWKRLGEQSVDGGTYDVGLVTYKAQTIFDELELQAKALIKNGKVVKWLWATTNTQMR